MSDNDEKEKVIATESILSIPQKWTCLNDDPMYRIERLEDVAQHSTRRIERLEKLVDWLEKHTEPAKCDPAMGWTCRNCHTYWKY